MKLFKITLVLFLIVTTNYAQNKLQGTITTSNGDIAVGTTVYIKSLKKGTTTNFEGYYELNNIETGTYQVIFQSLGYKTQIKNVIIKEDLTILDIILQEDSSQLDEVVISASRSSEKLSEVPASITIVGAKKLQELTTATTNLNEILEFSVPGLAPNTGTLSNWGQTLRGRQLLVMVDGIPQSTPLRNGKVGLKAINPNDIKRVEVIKGATSIYGNGSDGGFVNYITKEPTSDKGIHGKSNIWQTVNLAKTKDAFGWGFYQSLTGNINNLSYYVSGSFEQTGNKYDAKKDPLLPTYGLDNTKIFSVLGKIGYQINDNQKMSARFTHYKSRQHTPFVPTLGAVKVINKEGNYEITHGIGVLPSSVGDKKGKPMGATTTSAQVTYNLENIFNETTNLQADVYYQKAKNIFFYSKVFKNGGQSVINSEKFGFRPNFHTKLNIEVPVDISLTYGVDLLKDKTNQGLLDGRLWVPNIDLVSIAPYLQTKLKYNDQWVFKAGIRHDDMSLNIVDYATLPRSPKQDGNFTTSIDVKGGKLDFKSTSFNIGVRYIKNDEFIPYINYSQGFSLPDLGRTLRSAKAKKVEDISLESITTNNYEFGFLSKFKHVRFEAVGFYSTSNLGLGVIFNDKTNNFEASKNPQKIYGAEFSLDFRYLEDKLQFGTSYSYVEGLKHPPADPANLSYIGGDVISPPKTTAYLRIQPTKKLTTSLRLVHVGNRKRFNVKEKAGVFSYSYREVPVKAYTLLNLTSSYQIKSNIKLSLAVNNLLNNFYLPARAQWSSPLRSQVTAGEGINAKLGLIFDF